MKIEDLKRRDFTINAMAYNEKEGLIDAFDGMGDLEKGHIRCVGDPRERFTGDGLRILRAVRFSARRLHTGIKFRKYHRRNPCIIERPATYRIDGEYQDGRHPSEVIFTPSLLEDLKRRDFTIAVIPVS